MHFDSILFPGSQSMCLLKLYKAKTTFVYRSPTPHQNSLRSFHLASSRETLQRETAVCVVTKGIYSVSLKCGLNLDCGYVLQVNRAEMNHLSPEIIILTLLLETLACVLWLEQSCSDLSSNTWYWTLKGKKNTA